MPNGQKGYDHIYDVFVTQYGLTMDEAATLILGGHSLGHVHPEHSGYGYNAEEMAAHDLVLPDDDSVNAWDSTPQKFDNRNAGNLIMAGWLNTQNFNGHMKSNTKNFWTPNRAANGQPSLAPALVPRAAPSVKPTTPAYLNANSVSSGSTQV